MIGRDEKTLCRVWRVLVDGFHCAGGLAAQPHSSFEIFVNPLIKQKPLHLQGRARPIENNSITAFKVFRMLPTHPLNLVVFRNMIACVFLTSAPPPKCPSFAAESLCARASHVACRSFFFCR